MLTFRGDPTKAGRLMAPVAHRMAWKDPEAVAESCPLELRASLVPPTTPTLHVRPTFHPQDYRVPQSPPSCVGLPPIGPDVLCSVSEGGVFTVLT